MICKSCEKEIPDNVTECPHCHTVVSENTVSNPLLGKKYSFVSARGSTITGLTARIFSDVEVFEDRIRIEMKPKRLNRAPVILLEDIMAIQISKRINFYYWFFIIVSIFLAFSSPLYLLLTALTIFLGIERKIQIVQRNGITVTLYSHDKELAEIFVEDMKTITKIM